MYVVVGAVVCVDQATKWWGWRHVPAALINTGSDPLTGSVVDSWYTGRVSGAFLDLLDTCLLAVLLVLTVRSRNNRLVLVSAAVMLGGWASNTLDRLGLHYWTAPGSARGVVDFMPLGRFHYNSADVCIVIATSVLLAMIGYLAVRRCGREPIRAAAPQPPRRHGPVARRIVAAAALGLVAVVAVGAADTGGVTRHQPPPSTTAGFGR